MEEPEKSLELDCQDGRASKKTSSSARSAAEIETVANLRSKVEEKDKEIDSLTKCLAKSERQLEKANNYNEDLRKELSKLSSELHKYRNIDNKTVFTQVSETDIEDAYGNKPMPEWGGNLGQDGGELSIPDSLKAAAEAELQSLGRDNTDNQQPDTEQSSSDQHMTDASSEYVYDAATGFYYHPLTGYYWDPNSGLFYDYTTGTYYSYNDQTGEYDVHSVVDVAGQSQMFGGSYGTKNELYTNCASNSNDVDSLSSRLSTMKLDPQKCRKSALEMAENYPPCIRVVVQESDHLKLGSLYIITCAGGSIGREPNMGHAIEICDLNVSKLHAQIQYDYGKMSYIISDKGSQNGTLLNGSRLSKSKSESDSHALSHGDILQIGSTKLLLHIHKGHETCEDCEPGQVQAKLKALNPIKNEHVVLSQEEKNRQRRRELKNIKKKYGLQNSSYENPGAIITNPDYCDKAHLRREFIGSEADVPKIDESPASVQSFISSSNKGHKLLSKMGWKEGEGLGKTSSGISEPINVEMRVNQSAGLGSAAGVSVSLDNVQQSGKAKRWSAARERYHKLQVAESQSTAQKPSVEQSQSSAHASSHHSAQSIRQHYTENTSVSKKPVTLSVFDGGDTSDPSNEISTAASTANISLCSRDPYVNPEDTSLSSSLFNTTGSSANVQQLPQTTIKSKPKISWVRGGTEQVGQLVPPSSHPTDISTDSSKTEEHPP